MSMTLQIGACKSGSFPMLAEEIDNQDESTHKNTGETDEEVRLMRRCRTYVQPLTMTLIEMSTTLRLRRMTMSLWSWFIWLILTILSILRVWCPDV
jgi:hypothetical protein